MKKVFIASIIYFTSCVAPSQPPLSKKEATFISSIERKYAGQTKRNIEVALLIEKNNNRKGSYSLDTHIKCDSLFNLGKDSGKIQRESFQIAKTVYTDVLDRDIKYNKIMVSFSCDTASYKYKDLIFEFRTDSL